MLSSSESSQAIEMRWPGALGRLGGQNDHEFVLDFLGCILILHITSIF